MLCALVTFSAIILSTQVLPCNFSDYKTSLTPKSLKTFIKGQSKYYRTSANGGWSDLKFYNNSGYKSIINVEGVYMASVQVAISNLYYNDSEIADFYKYNQNAGYPQKQSLNQGYTGSYYNEDLGAWGNNIIGVMWLEMEDNFNF